MDKVLILNKIKEHLNLRYDKDFAEFLDVKTTTLSMWYKRNTYDIELLFKKCEFLSADWLLTGKGSMLKSLYDDPKLDELEKTIYNYKKEVDSIINEPGERYHKESRNMIPLFDGVVTAGMQETAMLDPTHEPVEMIDAGDWFRDATAAMRVHGDSMYPEYKSGSIAALREVHNKRLVVYGQDYLIETTEYRVIKRLQKSDLPQNWLACSVNEDTYVSNGRLIHEPFDIHIDDVRKLYQVLGNVKRNQSSTVIYAGKPNKNS